MRLLDGDSRVPFKVQPFSNLISTVSLTRGALLGTLEAWLSGRAASQVAGLHMTWNPSLPAGSRVVEVLIGGEPLELELVYRVTNAADGWEGDIEGARAAADVRGWAHDAVHAARHATGQLATRMSA